MEDSVHSVTPGLEDGDESDGDDSHASVSVGIPPVAWPPDAALPELCRKFFEAPGCFAVEKSLVAWSNPLWLNLKPGDLRPETLPTASR